MQMLLKIEANEIDFVPELTYYNNVHWKLKKPFMGFTHFVEKYDDVYDTPDYLFGNIKDGEFVELLRGEGARGIDDIYVGFGGVWFDVYINVPEQYFVGVA